MKRLLHTLFFITLCSLLTWTACPRPVFSSESVLDNTISVPVGKPFIIQINGNGEKSVFFPHSGQDIPDLKHIRSDLRKSDTLALYPEDQRHKRTYQLYDYHIAKSESTDYQQGTVGTQLPTQLGVIVTDNESSPVSGVEITFRVREGGGVFPGDLTSITAITDAKGRASVSYILGKRTYANPVGWLEAGKNMQNVGLNVVDAYPAGESLNKVTFYAYGFPDEPASLSVQRYDKTNDDEKPVIHNVSEMGVSVFDVYNNPVSNLPVTVEVIDVADRGGTSCAVSNQDQRPMLLVPSSEYGNPVNNVVSVPTPYEEYAAYGGPMEITTKHIAVYWEVYTGGVPNARYTLKITCGNLTKTETFLTKQMGNCDGNSPPESDVWGVFTYTATTEIGKGSRVNAWLYRYQEEAVEAPETCGECTEDYVGARKFNTNSDFSSVGFKLRINGKLVDVPEQVSTPYGVTVSYEFDVPDTSSADTFRFEFSYSDHPYGWETTGACICRVPAENTDTLKYSFNIGPPVLIHTPEKKIVPVNADGLLTCDIEIPFSIDNFYSGIFRGQIYADGEIVLNNHLLSSGEEPFKLFRGYPFDLSKNYTARIIAYDTEDYNTGITGDPVEFVFEPEIIRSVYVKDTDALPLLPGGVVQLYAETAEETDSGDMVWSVVDTLPDMEEMPVIAEISADTGLLSVNAASGYGYVIIACHYKDCEYKTARVKIGCGCTGGTCGTEGNGTVALDSVNVRMSLGTTSDGRSGGDIFLTADTMTAGLYTPALLDYSALVTGNEVITDADGALRQILTPRTFADVVTISAQSYEVRFYHSEEVGIKADGLYSLSSGAEPFVTWRFENPDAGTGLYARLRVSSIQDGKTTVSEYSFDKASGTWTLSEADGERITTKTRTMDNGIRTEDEIVTGADGAVSSHIRRIYGTFPWGESVIRKTSGPDDANLTSYYTWYEDANDTGSYGKRQSVKNPDGSWRWYIYDDRGRLSAEYRSYLDIPMSSKESARCITWSYDASLIGDDDADADEDRDRPRRVTETIGGITVSQTFYAYGVAPDGTRTEITERCTGQGCTYGAVGSLRTVRVYYPSTAAGYAAGRIRQQVNPDGTVVTCTYETGIYNDTAHTFTAGDGSDIRQTVVHGTTEAPDGVAFRTLEETTVTDSYGHPLLTEEYVYTGTAYERIGWKAFTLDDFGRTVRTVDMSGAVTETAWGCCDRDSHTDEQGITTAWIHDALKRIKTEIRTGPTGNIVTTYSYDASGRMLAETTTAEGLSLATARTCDTAGRLLTTTDTQGLVSGYVYENGGSRKIISRPGGITEISETYADGQTKSVTGTGVIPEYHTYGVETDGSLWARRTLGSSSGARWEMSVTDIAGRIVRTEKPGPEGTEVSEIFYNTKGRVSRITAPGKADTLYGYDTTGTRITTALDVNSNGIIDEAGDDRITRSDTFYTRTGGNWQREQAESVALDAGSAAFTTVAVTRNTLTGLAAGVVSETESEDAHGNITTVRTAVNRASATLTVTTDAPDSDIDAVSTSVRGYRMSNTDKTGLTVTWGYDALGRRTKTADPKTGTVITRYNSLGQVESIEAPAGKSVSYGYDPVTGRKITETGEAGKVTRYAFNDRGQVTHIWGDVPVPAWYEYNTYGSLVHLHTFREGAGWTAGIWPSDAGEGDVTTWIYDEATGLLSEKRYADSKGVTYTYLAGGRLHTRTWARIADGAAPVTTYGYNSATGELSDISYSDETPAIALILDRAGREETVTDALGTRTFTYDGVSPDTEILSGLYERTIDYDYESATDGVPGRLSGFSAGPEYKVSYAYEHGRISGVNREISGQTGAVSYGYENGLVTGIFFNGGPTVTRTYDPAERYLTQVRNEGTDGIISQYDYTHDNLGRRKTLTYSGSAFDGDSYRRFAYNDRSEVTESSAFSGADVSNASSPLAPEHRTYSYDPIGNRTAATDWNAAAGAAQPLTYTADELNRYTEIAMDTQTNTPEYDDDGNMTRMSADSGVMTYNAENRLSSVEYKTLAGDVNGDGETNLSDAISALQVVAGAGTTGTADGDINGDYRIGIEEAVYCLRVAAGLEDPVVTERKLVFTYDYMGRRVKKAVYSGNAYTPDRTVLFVWNGWNMIEEITGQGGTENSRYFVWGLDLSQSFNGAGGIGGLLCAVNGDAAYYYLYDGNGNAGQVVNAGNGAVAAHYEYDPFGNLTAKSGLYADANPFRFSTKYLDAETGLYYYGYRYYSPEIGRWISRDPIWEQGHELVKKISETIHLGYSITSNEIISTDFIDNDPYLYELLQDIGIVEYDSGSNLYHFVNNDSVNDFDILGENPAAWRVVVGIVGGVAKWVIKKVTKGTAKQIAQKELKRRTKLAAECGVIHTQYKETEKHCRACNSQTTHNERNCVCWSAAVAGRSFYIKKKCDYYWPAAVAKGSKKQEAAHKAQLAATIRAEARCCGLCLAH